ncbi:hypothetical protein [Halobellus sp. GM3]|uniref:hypothetical protein n=1 Tax=Halobellus sp. GM3 TaxID=3458410 RepID=UPI00403DC115
MQQQTTVDVVVDAGTAVASALAASVRRRRRNNRRRDERADSRSEDRPGTGGRNDEANGPHAGAAEAFVVGTLLVLATGRVPLLGVLLAGYVVVSARDREVVVSAFRAWPRLGIEGFRASAVVAAAAIPAGAALVGAGLLRAGGVSGLFGAGGGAGGELGGQLTVSGTAGPAALAGLGIAALLACLVWYGAVVGIAALAWSGGRSESVRSTAARFVRSPAIRRLALALAGVGVAVGVGRFGVGAVPVVGPVLAAGVTFFGVAVAARLIERVLRNESHRIDRLATGVERGSAGRRRRDGGTQTRDGSPQTEIREVVRW